MGIGASIGAGPAAHASIVINATKYKDNTTIDPVKVRDTLLGIIFGSMKTNDAAYARYLSQFGIPWR